MNAWCYLNENISVISLFYYVITVLIGSSTSCETKESIFSMQCLGQNVKFDCIGSWSLPFHLYWHHPSWVQAVCIYFYLAQNLLLFSEHVSNIQKILMIQCTKQKERTKLNMLFYCSVRTMLIDRSKTSAYLRLLVLGIVVSNSKDVYVVSESTSFWFLESFNMLCFFVTECCL